MIVAPVAALGLKAGQKTAAKIGVKVVTKIGSGILGSVVYGYAAPKLIKNKPTEESSTKEKMNFHTKNGALFSGSVFAADCIGNAISGGASVAIEGAKGIITLIL